MYNASVADSNPEFFDPWISEKMPDLRSRINIPDHISKSLVRNFGLKRLVADPNLDPVPFLPGSGLEEFFGSGIRDKHSRVRNTRFKV